MDDEWKSFLQNPTSQPGGSQRPNSQHTPPRERYPSGHWPLPPGNTRRPMPPPSPLRGGFRPQMNQLSEPPSPSRQTADLPVTRKEFMQTIRNVVGKQHADQAAQQRVNDESSKRFDRIEHDTNKRFEDVAVNQNSLIQFTSDMQTYDEGPPPAEPGSNFGDQMDWPSHAQ